ncbi:MAG: hypothetical protein K6G22_10270 [Lachnospiraceae bacterium]|nr:hypothetical protein [Lachnospiraceae bacterium]
MKAQEEASLAKANDVLNAVKVGEILKKKGEIEREEKKRSKIWIIVGIIVFIVVFAAALYGLYCYFTPDYLEDFDDEIDDEEEDEFEDDFFEDEEGNSDQN